MKDYVQPEFYHFNEDSLNLVSIVNHFIGNKKISTCLDLGAGCGVIGCELSKCLSIEELTFLEIQDEFLSSLKINIKQQLSSKGHIIQCSFKEFKNKTFDLIVSNPPFYQKNKSRISPDKRRAICRSFIVDSFDDWFATVVGCMTKNSEAFFVVDVGLEKELSLLVGKQYNLELIQKKKNSLFFHLFF